ncbi:MAG: hypothetical protein HYV20_00755 [Gemmatimonadetes bacterium]|nr:hypothetical protein [Gemmatimonadota bacterium]
MSQPRAWIGGGALAVGMTLVLGWLSQVPYDAAGDVDAVVRLAWRTRGTRVEECRRLTAAERERLPIHMRQEEVCQGRTVPYRLVVVLDGRSVVNEAVYPSGARADRPLYVYHEFAVRPGWHDLDIAFTREGVPSDTAGEQERERLGERESAAPPRLALTRRVMLGPDQIVLVTYDAEQRQLILKGYGAP